MNTTELAELFARPCPGSNSWAVNHALSIIPLDTPDREGLAEDATQEVALYFLERTDLLADAEGPGVIHYAILRRTLNELRDQGRRAVGVGSDIEELAAASFSGADLAAEGDEFVDVVLAEYSRATVAQRSLLDDLLKAEPEHRTPREERARSYRRFQEDVMDSISNRPRAPRNEHEDFEDAGRTAYRGTQEFATAAEAAAFQNLEHSLAARPGTLDLDHEEDTEAFA